MHKMFTVALSVRANTENDIETHIRLCVHYFDYCGKNTQSQQVEEAELLGMGGRRFPCLFSLCLSNILCAYFYFQICKKINARHLKNL